MISQQRSKSTNEQHIIFFASVGNSQASDLQMVMRYGRQDCGDSPREQAEDFPNPRMGLDGVLSWCSRVFDFSDRECVAILGKIICGEGF